MNSVCPFGEQYQKYWDKRYQYFSKFDEGIQIDLEGLYSVCPEEIAFELAQYVRPKIIIDGFCGVGGNMIGFAKIATKVIAIDKSQDRLAMAKNNANIYGCHNIEYMHGDFLDLIKKIQGDAVFLAPSWGGPSYSNLEKFTLNHYSPNGKVLLDSVLSYFKTVILETPRNFDFTELEQFSSHYDIFEGVLGGKVVLRYAIFRKTI